MAFSGALTLTDLNDFITPSQACIKPVEQLNKPAEAKTQGAATTEIRIDESGSYYEVPALNASNGFGNAPDTKLEQAQISLNDCLACSGCITSAESVLITLQSHAEVMTFLSNNGDPESSNYRLPIMSIAPQSLASLATSLSMTLAGESPTGAAPTLTPTSVTPRQVLRRVQQFCSEVLGFTHVFDTTFARHLALQEHVREFDERKERDRQGVEQQLPMLASACPGWICYAEKAHSEMLPFIAKTKSPQQVMGTLVKNWIAKKLGKLPHQIYHVSVMPCYDKKLEASRPDFYDDVYSTRDVDCVITTGELELLMRERGGDISLPVVGELDPWTSSSIPAFTPLTTGPGVASESTVVIPELVQHSGTSSGSYLQAIISHIIATSKTPLTLSVKTLRNADSEEYTLRRRQFVIEGENRHQQGQGHQGNDQKGVGDDDGRGEIVFKGAKCYGFRNLQNLVRKIGRERGVRVGGGAAGKLSSSARGGGAARRLVAARKNRETLSSGVGEDERRFYDYVEVMACPGGCVNGGGQLKPPASFVGEVTPNPIVNEDQDLAGGTMQNNAKWGNREWTKRVEETYWKDVSGTIPSTSLRIPNVEVGLASGAAPTALKDTINASVNGKRVGDPRYPNGQGLIVELPRDHVATGEGNGANKAKLGMVVRSDWRDDRPVVAEINSEAAKPKEKDVYREEKGEYADWLVERILQDMQATSGAERERWFRTEYRAVESEVVGLAVKW